jgi:hypothetical protein
MCVYDSAEFPPMMSGWKPERRGRSRVLCGRPNGLGHGLANVGNDAEQQAVGGHDR